MRVSRLTIFLAVQGILYVVFLALDFTGSYAVLSNGIKFTVIILCLLYTLSVKKGKGAGDISLVRFALFFTLLSDYIILFLDTGLYLYGVFSFVIVQQLYGFRLKGMENCRQGLARWQGAMRAWLLQAGTELAAAAVIILLFKAMGVSLNVLLMVTVFYFVSLVHNVVYAVLYAVRKPRPQSIIIFAAGLVLFLLCDIHVGIYNLSDFILFTGKTAELLYRLASLLMWTFYAPSQVLIAVSADRFRQ